MHAARMLGHGPVRQYRSAPQFAMPRLNASSLLSAGAGLGLGALLFGGRADSLIRIGAPLGGAFLGWTRGDDLLRRSPVAQSMVGFLAGLPGGSLLGRDPYKPVGGALGAAAGALLGSFFT